MNVNRGPLVSEATALPTEAQTTAGVTGLSDNFHIQQKLGCFVM